jgi:hypothetical protein
MDEALKETVEAWRKTLVGAKVWVLFENGTCVVLVKPEEDPQAQATALLEEWGPVHVGSPSADFSVVTLKNGLGWVVTCHHNDILTLVFKDEIDLGDDGDANTVAIGMAGRGKRRADAEALNVVHVEDMR